MGDICCGGTCPRCWAGKLIVIGVVLILARIYTNWDIWIVVGTIILLKGLLMLVMPTCPHCEEKSPRKKK